MQTIVITGRVGADAEIRTAGNSEVTSFSVAVDQHKPKITIWYRCSIWGERGRNLAGYITKGAKVALNGDLTHEEYNGKPQLNVRVNDIDPFLGAKPEGNGGTNTDRKPAPAAFDTDLDDDVPFAANDGTHEGRLG